MHVFFLRIIHEPLKQKVSKGLLYEYFKNEIKKKSEKNKRVTVMTINNNVIIILEYVTRSRDALCHRIVVVVVITRVTAAHCVHGDSTEEYTHKSIEYEWRIFSNDYFR